MTLQDLRGGLIVSVQAWKGSAMDDPHVIAAMARAAQESGAVGVRIEGVEDLRAVRERVSLPIVGLVKRAYPGFEPYITPTIEEVAAIAACGAEIVAFDATPRPRPGGVSVAGLVAAIHAAGRLALADCATVADGAAAVAAGADAIASTLCGYTPETAGQALPALDLVRELAQLQSFCLCEGGVRSPAGVRAALDAGADAVVVGSAITNVDWLVREFAGAADRGS
ncbi:MAG TPA: N-acetylmannosamine-6-phosphate 2-epimerase [Candidatus Binatia bacterium]|nr:N-acetylmannosamine-6-phosphate 2-epimerase [Candidatus Binatia bacterium]